MGRSVDWPWRCRHIRTKKEDFLTKQLPLTAQCRMKVEMHVTGSRTFHIRANKCAIGNSAFIHIAKLYTCSNLISEEWGAGRKKRTKERGGGRNRTIKAICNKLLLFLPAPPSSHPLRGEDATGVSLSFPLFLRYIDTVLANISKLE